MNANQTIVVILGLCLQAAGCGVDSESNDTGGIDPGSSPAPVRGFAVVNSDYDSASVSLLSPSGEVLSASFISSASADPGLSAALSGDLVLPTTTVTGPELVLVDRLPGSVITWVNLETATVRAQLSVATGFTSNPHEYVPYSATKAFVTRFEVNLASGAEEYDQGDDVLVVDPERAAITARIDLGPAMAGEPAGFFATPDRALMAGGKLRVLALGFNDDLSERVASRLITIDPESHAIEHVLVFEGMNSCGGLALSPDGTELAVACNGAFGTDPAEGFPDSGVLVVALGDEPVETARWTSPELGITQVNNLEWVGRDHVALVTYGRYNEDRSAVVAKDGARTLDVRAGTITEPWLESRPFRLGELACSLSHQTCLLADAETDGGVVQILHVDDAGTVTSGGSVKPDAGSGLPPRYLGTY